MTEQPSDDEPQRNLLIDGRWERFFIVPSTLTLPDGDLSLRTPRGDRQQVDPDTVAPYQVERPEAMAFLRDELGAHLYRVTAGLRERATADRGEAMSRLDAAETLQDKFALVGEEIRKTLQDPSVKAALSKLQQTLREGPRGAQARRRDRTAKVPEPSDPETT